LCEGQAGGDKANISNIGIYCGLVTGMAGPLNKSDDVSLFFPLGANWTQPLYSCASAAKAIIKTVRFKYNGTRGLEDLVILNTPNKVYGSDKERPFWAVENVQRNLSFYDPIWGLSHPRYETHQNLSTLQKDSLWLPGYSNFYLEPYDTQQNIPGANFHMTTFSQVYAINGAKGLLDYTGASSFPIYKRWFELSRNATGAAHMLNLIWTDIAANAVVGTRGWTSQLSPTNLAKRASNPGDDDALVPIYIYRRRVHFKYSYGVPAFIVCAFAIGVIIATVALSVMRKTKFGKLNKYMDHTSLARNLTAMLYPKECSQELSKKEWDRHAAKKQIMLGKERPCAADEDHESTDDDATHNNLTSQETSVVVDEHPCAADEDHETTNDDATHNNLTSQETSVVVDDDD
jgi:hypothetical protein